MRIKTKMNFELACAWSGALWILLYFITWTVIARVQPPLSYSATAVQAANFYLSRQSSVILGMGLSAIVGGLWIPWTAQLTVVLWRIEGEAPVLSITQLIGGALTAVDFIFIPVMWLMPAFQSDANPELIKAFSDFAYLMFNCTFIVSTIQAAAAGMVGLADERVDPIFPPIVCWASIVAGLLMGLVAITTFVKTGPFALEGWFDGWVPGVVFFLWTGVITYYLIKDAGSRKRRFIQNGGESLSLDDLAIPDL